MQQNHSEVIDDLDPCEDPFYKPQKEAISSENTHSELPAPITETQSSETARVLEDGRVVNLTINYPTSPVGGASNPGPSGPKVLKGVFDPTKIKDPQARAALLAKRQPAKQEEQEIDPLDKEIQELEAALEQRKEKVKRVKTLRRELEGFSEQQKPQKDIEGADVFRGIAQLVMWALPILFIFVMIQS